VIWCIRRSSASRLFEQHGFHVVYEPRVTPFLHISDGFYGVRQPHRVLAMLWGQLRSYRTARRMFSQLRPDIIHINSIVVPGVLCAAARCGCPVIVNVLECVHPGYMGVRARLLRALTKRWADRFVFMLPSEARRWGLADATAAVTVFDFIDLAPFREAAATALLRTTYNVPATTPLIGYFGRFTPAKGVHLLLKALGRLKRSGAVFQAVLVGPLPARAAAHWLTRLKARFGRRPYIERLHAIIARENLHGCVAFTGELQAVADAVRECDVLVVPFIEPHFSRLCAEGAAAGRVVVAFDIDGPGEEIIDGVTGVLAQPFDVEDLAFKLRWTLTHAEQRSTMGAAARAHAANVFDAEKNMAAVHALYARLAV
jgi:glycosyltransferase involved in cell wall biosynthesis